MLASPSRVLLPLVLLVLAALVAACSSGSGTSTGGDPVDESPSTPGTTTTSAGSTSQDGGAGTTSPTATATAAPDTAAPAPEVGTCRTLPSAALNHFTDHSPAVDCAKPHTGYTLAVKQLPDDVAIKGVDIANKSIQHAAATMCHDAFVSFIGGSAKRRALSRFSVTYYLPPQADFDRGAHWVRCDLVANKTQHSLAPLPEDPRGYLDGQDALDDYGLCSPGAPGKKKFALVMCSQKHTYRAVTAIKLGAKSAKYPGTDVTREDGQRQCASYIKKDMGKTGGYTYGWTYPTPKDWDNGQRYGYCWLKTKK